VDIDADGSVMFGIEPQMNRRPAARGPSKAFFHHQMAVG
jgi:hypothetical protein